LIVFFTNGTLVNDKFIQMFKRVNSSTHVFVSLDGLTPYAHGKIRGIQNSLQKRIFNQTLEGVKKLVQNDILCKVNTIIHKYNVRELPKMYYLMKKLGIKMWRLSLSKFVGRYKKTYKKFVPTKNNLFKAYRKLLELFLQDVKVENKKIIIPLDLRIANVFKSEMLIKPLVSYTINDSTCEYQKNRVTIKPNGDVVPCGLLVDYPIGNIRKMPLKKIWYSREMQYFKKFKIKNVIKCKECKYVKICGTGCRANSLFSFGDLFHPDDDACLCFNFWEDMVELVKQYGFEVKIINKKK